MRTYTYRLNIHLTGSDRATITLSEVQHVNGTKLHGRVIRSAHCDLSALWAVACADAAHLIRIAEDKAYALRPDLALQLELPAGDARPTAGQPSAAGTRPPDDGSTH